MSIIDHKFSTSEITLVHMWLLRKLSDRKIDVRPYNGVQ